MSRSERPSLEWKDYVALFIAALETIVVPLIVFMIILIVLVLILR